MSKKTPKFTSNGRCAGPTLTKINTGETRCDTSFAKSSSIEFILKNFTTSGTLPFMNQEAQYIDTSLLPNNLTDMSNIMDELFDRFEKYPSQIRAAMRNDPRNLPEFAASIKGQQLLREAGLLPPLPTAQPATQTGTSAEQPAQSPAEAP